MLEEYIFKTITASLSFLTAKKIFLISFLCNNSFLVLNGSKFMMFP